MKQPRLMQNIIGGSYEADSKIAGTAYTLNMYAENVEEFSSGSYNTSSLRSRDGERIAIGNLGGKCRGIFVASDNSIFAMFGQKMYRIKYDEVSGEYEKEVVFTDSVNNDTKICFTETGGVNSHVVWVDGSLVVYAYPIDKEKAQVNGISVPIMFVAPKRVYLTSDQIVVSTGETIDVHVEPTQVCSIKGCLVINDPDTDTWYYTEPYILGGTTYERSVYKIDSEGNVIYKEGSKYEVDTKTVKLYDTDPVSGTSYLWLDRYSVTHWQVAEYTADKTVGMIVSSDVLYILGERSIQAYVPGSSTDALGNSYMVFSSSSNNVNDIGCKDYRSISAIGNGIAFLGSGVLGDGSIWAMEGSSPVRISTNALEREIAGASVEYVNSISINEFGHNIYCISFPSIGKTFCFDFATRQWHNRSTSYANGTMKEWWPKYSVKSKGVTYVSGDIESLVAMDSDKYDDYKGDVILKQRISSIVCNDYSPFVINDIQLLLNNGETEDVNNVNGARNPVVMLSVSKDGGHNYGTEKWGYCGKIGQYSYRTIWRSLGKVTMAVLKFTISDRCKVVITGAKISITPLRGF